MFNGGAIEAEKLLVTVFAILIIAVVDLNCFIIARTYSFVFSYPFIVD
jgi:hypothetical protein